MDIYHIFESIEIGLPIKEFYRRAQGGFYRYRITVWYGVVGGRERGKCPSRQDSKSES